MKHRRCCKSWFKVDFKYTKTQGENPKTRTRNIIWFNTPLNKAVLYKCCKNFFQLINKHIPKCHRLQKIFNRNTVKVIYRYMQNIYRILKRHNSKIISTPCNQLTLCNCRVKEECSMNIKCKTMEAFYDCCVI